MNDLIERMLSSIQKHSEQKIKSWWENYIKHNTKFRENGIPKIREELKSWYEEENM